MTRVLLLLLVACKSTGSPADDVPFVPTARVDGPMVVIEVRCPDTTGEIQANGQRTYCSYEKRATLRLPAAGIGTGKHTIAVSYQHRRDTRTENVTVDIPASATGPYLTVDKCEDDFQDKTRAQLDLVVDGKGKQDCSSFHGARAKVDFRATPGGKLTLGTDKPLDVPASGELEATVDLTPAIMALKLDDFAVSGLSAKTPPMEVAYAFDAGGKHLTGTLAFQQASFEMGKLFHVWLHDLVDGKIDRPAFTPPAAGERKTILFLDSHDDVQTTDRRGTVKELDYVATIKETGRKEAGTCEFETSGKKTVAKRYGVDSEVTVTSLADGKVVVTKPFPAPSGCPMVAMLDPNKPETSVIVNKNDVMAWLETLAKP